MKTITTEAVVTSIEQGHDQQHVYLRLFFRHGDTENRVDLYVVKTELGGLLPGDEFEIAIKPKDP